MGRWQTVYGVCGRWQLDGTWLRILAALQGRADAAADHLRRSGDSMIARAHQYGRGASKGTCRLSRPRASPPITAWAGPGAG